MLKTHSILEELNKISKELGLKFNKNWFNVVWITKEQEILTEYLSDCRDPIYEKYGHELSERIKNLKQFYNSKDYKKCITRYGGQAISKNSFFKTKIIIKKLDDSEAKNILLDFCERVGKEINKFNKIATLTETEVDKERKHLFYEILRHEWIHILLGENNLNSNNWKYNEGLVTYFEFFMDKRLNKLESALKSERYDFNKEYFLNAILFRELLKNSPDKKKIILIKKFIISN